MHFKIRTGVFFLVSGGFSVVLVHHMRLVDLRACLLGVILASRRLGV